jgi:glyoxylase-like metal-dependent hydrolase (beta-lactamase superfamily II)
MEITEIREDFFHFRSAEKVLHRNIYVKRLAAPEADAGAIVFDPGAKADAPALWEVLEQTVGGVANVDVVFLSHQDPDVASNAKFVVDNAPRAFVLASVDAWRLLNTTGIPDNRFYLVESWGEESLELSRTGHRVHPVPAHYCHFRGSLMLYDYESRVLFSGDLFGGIDTRGGGGIYADETSWEGISLFHQIYMPSTRAVREAIGRVARLEPPPTIIAPQHGDVIAGALVTEFMSRLAGLDVGVDLEKLKDPEKNTGVEALNAFFRELKAAAPAAFERVWAEATRRNEFTTLFKISQGRIMDLKVSVANAVVYICNLTDKVVRHEERDKVKILLSVALEERGVSVPAFCLVGTHFTGGAAPPPA